MSIRRLLSCEMSNRDCLKSSSSGEFLVRGPPPTKMFANMMILHRGHLIALHAYESSTETAMSAWWIGWIGYAHDDDNPTSINSIHFSDENTVENDESIDDEII